jgi:hypothetical protein
MPEGSFTRLHDVHAMCVDAPKAATKQTWQHFAFVPGADSFLLAVSEHRNDFVPKQRQIVRVQCRQLRRPTCEARSRASECGHTTGTQR